MTEFKFELERSAYFKNRSELLKSNGTPKLSDTKTNLGDTVANVIFQQCENALREDFGLKYPLKGPGDVLWVSPSDLLIGKNALKPPFTPKCLQALTHKGILEIGQGLEDKFIQEMELDKQKALEKYKTELLATVEERMKSEIKDVEIRERLACHMKMERQQQEFEIVLKDELDKLEMRIREEYEKIIANHESSLKTKWENKLQQEVKKTVELMTKKFLSQLDEQQERITQIFQFELKKQEILRAYDAKLYKRKTIEALRQLKHNLECTNLVNMMYILCSERRKCCDQKAEIEKHYKREIKQLEDTITEKDKQVARVNAEKEQKIVEVSIRETCLVEVIKHFQKFINFALRAAPTQAEFLLCVEKMMSFELTNEIVKSEHFNALEFPRGREEPIINPWAQEKRVSASSARLSNLNIQDYHDCLHELNAPIDENAEELGENDILPAIYFKNKTYVREDFRNMLSNGVQLSPSSELWNRDVEILVANWRQLGENSNDTESVGKESTEERAEFLTSSSDKVQIENGAQAERRRSNKSTVQFSNGASQRQSVDSRKLGPKSSLKPSSFMLTEDLHSEMFTNDRKEGSSILAAKDSFEIIVEKKQVSRLSVPDPAHQLKDYTINEESEKQEFEMESDLPHSSSVGAGKELVVETKDSVVLRMTEMAVKQHSEEFVVSPKDSIEITRHTFDDKSLELKSRTSKISTARNSVDILRESLLKLQLPSLFCQKRDLKKQEQKEDKGQPSFAGTCCERCKRSSGLDSPTSDQIREGLLTKADSLGDSDERSVRISRIQIINLDEHGPTPSNVSFNAKPTVLRQSPFKKQTAYMGAKSNPATVTRKSSRKFSSRRTAPPYVCRISGEKDSKEGDKLNDEFTVERIHSLVKLMRDQPHLIQLFTAGSR